MDTFLLQQRNVSFFTVFLSVQTVTYSNTTGISKVFKMNSKLQPDDSIGLVLVTEAWGRSHVWAWQPSPMLAGGFPLPVFRGPGD